MKLTIADLDEITNKQLELISTSYLLNYKNFIAAYESSKTRNGND